MKTGPCGAGTGQAFDAWPTQLLFRALRDRLGFTRLRSAATGGAALGPDTFKFFRAMGVPLRTLYGQTELLGAYTLHPSGKVDPDTTGVPMADEIEIRVDNPDSQRRRRDRGAPPQHVSSATTRIRKPRPPT